MTSKEQIFFDKLVKTEKIKPKRCLSILKKVLNNISKEHTKYSIDFLAEIVNYFKAEDLEQEIVQAVIKTGDPHKMLEYIKLSQNVRTRDFLDPIICSGNEECISEFANLYEMTAKELITKHKHGFFTANVAMEEGTAKDIYNNAKINRLTPYQYDDCNTIAILKTKDAKYIYKYVKSFPTVSIRQTAKRLAQIGNQEYIAKMAEDMGMSEDEFCQEYGDQ